MLLDNRNVLPLLSTLYCRYDNDNNNKLWLIIKPQTYIQYCYIITSVHAQITCLCISIKFNISAIAKMW